MKMPTLKTGNHYNNPATEKSRSVEPDLNEISITGEYVPVSHLSPLPRIKENRRGSKRSISSQVITNSPYKQQLEEKKRQEEKKK